MFLKLWSAYVIISRGICNRYKFQGFILQTSRIRISKEGVLEISIFKQEAHMIFMHHDV